MHPCPVVGLVLTCIRFQLAGEPDSILATAEPFFEPPGTLIPYSDRVAGTDPAMFIASYLLAPGECQLIEVLD